VVVCFSAAIHVLPYKLACRMEAHDDPAVAMALKTAAEITQVPSLSPREGDLSVSSQQFLNSRVLRSALSTAPLTVDQSSDVQSMDGASFEEMDVDEEGMVSSGGCVV
jgi:hypothetical protein